MAAAFCLCASIASADGAATITTDRDGLTWRLTAGGATLTLRCGPDADFAVQQLTAGDGHVVTSATRSDTTITIDGHARTFGSGADGFSFELADVATDGTRKRLDIVYRLTDANLLVTRHYAVVDGAPVFETWTTLEAPPGRSVTVADLNAFALDVRPGRAWWVAGLQGDSTVPQNDTAFLLLNKTLASGETLEKGSPGRSSETTVPWLAIDEDDDEFFAALLWSGAWHMTATGKDTALSLAVGLGPMTTTVSGQPVNGPHALFGVEHGGLRSASPALRSYIVAGPRGGRPFSAPIVFNTWYVAGTEMDADSIKDEMYRAAMLGVEVFVIDAGWYGGAGANGIWDIDTGLGLWEPDASRFPDGLAPLSDLAHGLGMKFGIWMEPDRVEVATAGRPGYSSESWLATHGGDYGAPTTARVCLSGAGRDWVLAQITHVVETAHADYLKWDNNLWVNCDRPGHGHGDSDGNFADTTGYYSILAALRDRFPDLLIENCGGGGVRLDFGMLRYTDVAWVDDHTAPSAHVRHNLEGLTTAFPPAYLLSFVVDSEDEPLHEPPDLLLYFRSRMLGAMGLSFDMGGFPDGYWDAMTRSVSSARDARAAAGLQTGSMLTLQAESPNGPGWDVVQQASDDHSRIVILAFQTDLDVDHYVVKPVGLLPGVMYDVWSEDLGPLDPATSDALAADGIELEASTDTASHLLVLTARM
jgi:alpha-galactosidase